NAIPTASAVITIADGATLDLDGFDLTTGSLAGAGRLALGGATLTTGTDNRSTVFAGSIGGGGRLTKVGGGMLTLAGTSTHSLDTTIRAGTLRLAADDALGRAARVEVGGSGRLVVDGASTTLATLRGDGAVVLDGGAATLVLGAGNRSFSFDGVISGSGRLVKTGSG